MHEIGYVILTLYIFFFIISVIFIFENVPICYCLKNISATKDGYEHDWQLVATSKLTYANFSLIPEYPQNESNEPEESQDPKEPYEPDSGNLKGVVTDSETNLSVAGVCLTLKYHDIVQRTETDKIGISVNI